MHTGTVLQILSYSRGTREPSRPSFDKSSLVVSLAPDSLRIRSATTQPSTPLHHCSLFASSRERPGRVESRAHETIPPPLPPCSLAPSLPPSLPPASPPPLVLSTVPRVQSGPSDRRPKAGPIPNPTRYICPFRRIYSPGRPSPGRLSLLPLPGCLPHPLGPLLRCSVLHFCTFTPRYTVSLCMDACLPWICKLG
jgi:hypothetical protein